MNIDNVVRGIKYADIAPPKVAEDSSGSSPAGERIIDLDEVRRTAAFIMEKAERDAHHSAEFINTQAKARADRVVSQAITKAEEDAGEIRRKANEEGYNAGIEASKEEAAQIVHQAEAIQADAELTRKNMLEGLETEVVTLIIDIVDKLIGIEKEINPKLISMLVSKGLGQTTMTDKVAVHINPDDMEGIDHAEILASLDTMAKIEFIEDPTVPKTGCIIETSLGQIDCSLDTQYKELKRNLHYILDSTR